MKRIVLLSIFLVFVIILIVIFTNKVRLYSFEYDKDGFLINEKYDLNYYNFSVKKDDITFDFAFMHKYTNKRKLITNINYEHEEDSNIYCMSIDVFNSTTPVICYNGEYYYERSNEEYKNIIDFETINNINVFDNNYKYLIWNNYGFKDIINDKEYNFIDKEQYNNDLTYQLNDYLLIPDYNNSKTFRYFYVIDTKKMKMFKIKSKYEIYFDSYFLGDKNNLIYLFDKNNMREYSINIAKKKIKKVSDSNGGVVYDGKLSNYSLNDLKYKNVVFSNNGVYNFKIDDKKLVFNYYNSNKNIVLDDGDVDAIIGVLDDKVYYLIDDTIYEYKISVGKKKLASYFEWNFSFDNKVFIFDK